MKYIRQFAIILTISFLGELLNQLLPLPVPASIYGLVMMIVCLRTGIFPCEAVKETGTFLIEIMPLMFIPAAVGLLTSWPRIRTIFVPCVVITLVSTFAVMAVAGITTQLVIRHGKEAEEDE